MGVSRTRSIVVLAVTALVIGLIGAVAPAHAAGKPTQVKVVLATPAGMAAQAYLVRGKTRLVALKPPSKAARSKVVYLKVTPGARYRVKAATSVLKGVTYRPSFSKTVVKVKRGKAATVTVRWKKVTPPARLRMASTTDRTTVLAWSGAKKGSSFQVRRAIGQRPPRTVRAGARVYAGKGTKVTVIALKPGTTYSYSLFVKPRGKRVWSKPVTITVGTASAQGAKTAAKFALAPGGVLATSSDTVEIRSGRIWVTYASWRPAPTVGAGIVLPATATLPGGYVGQVAEVSAGGRRARLVQGGLPNTFSTLSVSTKIATAVRNPKVVRALVTRPSIPDSLSARIPTGPAKACVMGGSFGLDVMKITVNGSINMNVAANSMTIDASLTPGLSVGVHGAAGVKVACTISLAKVTVQIPVGPVATALVLQPQVQVRAEFAATGTVTASAGVTVGAKTRLGAGAYFTPRFSHSLATKAAAGLNGTTQVAAGGTLAWGPGLGNSYVGAMAGIYGDLYPIIMNGKSITATCYEASFGGAASQGFRAQAWLGLASMEATSKIVDTEWTYGAPARTPAGCPSSTPPDDGDPTTPPDPGQGTDLNGTAIHPIGPVGYVTRVTDINCPQPGPGLSLHYSVTQILPGGGSRGWGSDFPMAATDLRSTSPGPATATGSCLEIDGDNWDSQVEIGTYTAPVTTTPAPVMRVTGDMRPGGTITVSGGDYACAPKGEAARVNAYVNVTSPDNAGLVWSNHTELDAAADSQWTTTFTLPTDLPAEQLDLSAGGDCIPLDLDLSRWWSFTYEGPHYSMAPN